MMDIYLNRKLITNLRMLFCQLIISVLTRQSNLLDFGKAFKEFIPSSETPVSTRSRLPKIQRKIKHLPLSVSLDEKIHCLIV